MSKLTMPMFNDVLRAWDRREKFGAKLILGLALGSILIGGPAWGHDFWLEMDPVGTGAKTEERALHLRMGDAFKAEEERPLLKDKISRFDLYADHERRRDLLVAGQEGQKPVAKLAPEPGAGLAVMDRKEQTVTMDAEKFNHYLAEEGQDAVIAQRARLGQNTAEGKETYTRYLKVLVPGQDPLASLPNTLYKRRVGQRLEILLQNDPVRLPANRHLTVKVLFDGKPLAGAKVFAYRHEPATTGASGVGGSSTPTPTAATPSPAPVATPVPLPAGAVSAVTSTQGLADFKLDQNGTWLVRLVHLRAGTDRRTNPNGAWESYWGSYSFVVKDAPVGRETPAASGAK